MTYILMILILLAIVFISLLPAILIGKYIYKKDKDKEPKKLIIKLLIFGVLSIIPAIALSKFYDFIFPNQNTFFTVLCGYIIGVGLTEEVSKFLSGVKMIYCSTIATLEKFEVKAIDGGNKPFDPTYHQAVMTEEREGVEPGMVLEVLQKGYLLKDKVIRHAMVKVSQ